MKVVVKKLSKQVLMTLKAPLKTTPKAEEKQPPAPKPVEAEAQEK